MKILTQEQRRALRAIFHRRPLWRLSETMTTSSELKNGSGPLTYCQFRRMIEFSNRGFIMVPWCGIWLGVEPDGYIHS